MSALRTLSLALALAAVAATPAQAAPPTPTITGILQPGQTLTANHSGSDYEYRWYRCPRAGGECTWQTSATGRTYALTMQDYAKRIQVRLVDATGTSTSSALTEPVGKPVMATRPAISGDDVVLEATSGTWTPTGTNPSYLYEWLRCDLQGSNCVAVTQPDGYWRYTLTGADWAHRMRVRVTATTVAGSTSAVSFAREAYGKPYNRQAPVVSGLAAPGRTLTLSSGQWGWTDTIDAYDHAWLRCDSAGYHCTRIATGTTYVPGDADRGHRLRGMVTVTNEAGSTAKLSAPTRRVGAPIATQRPVITGTPKAGGTLSVSTGTWNPAPSSYAYRWERCPVGQTTKCTLMGTGASYTATAEDAGQALHVRVTGTNAYGSSTILTRQTAAVAAAH